MRLSARNQIPGTVKTLSVGAVMAEVVVEIAGGHQLVSAITAESARQLGLAPGKRVYAVVKSTEVMIGVED
jgi:molybdopterin-binding protein